MAIQDWQMRKIFAISRSIGMDNDELHALVEGETGSTSIKALDEATASRVIEELQTRQKTAGVRPPAKKSQRKHQETPGGVTKEQQAKVWKLMYVLAEHDPTKENAGLGGRLCGIIKRQFGVDAHPQQPFRFLSMQQGRELIETVKHMATEAELKAMRKGGVKHG